MSDIVHESAAWQPCGILYSRLRRKRGQIYFFANLASYRSKTSRTLNEKALQVQGFSNLERRREPNYPASTGLSGKSKVQVYM